MRVSTRSRLAASAAVLASLLGFAGTARADQADYYRGTHFTPELSVAPSTSQAGAHPDIAVRVRKTPSHCVEKVFEDEWATYCYPTGVYLEQDFKDIDLHLPPGLLADVNAAPQCDLRGSIPSYDYGPYPDRDFPCPMASRVGKVSVARPNVCVYLVGLGGYACSDRTWLFNVKPDSSSAGGWLFNAVPEPGEQAHLYAIVGICDAPYPRRCEPEHTRGMKFLARIDIGVRLRTESDWGIEASATGVPDALCANAYSGKPGDGTGCPPFPPESSNDWTPYPLHDMIVTLYGSAGANRDRPFTLNPTSCQARAVSASLRGYAQNVWDSDPSDTAQVWLGGSGDGTTGEASASYPVVGCNSLDYSPELSVSLDTPLPEATSAITSVVTQGEGEQTTKRVEVRLPKSFKVNFANRLAQCSADQAAARSCPGEAKVGEVTAESNLLPETGDLAGPLRGEVFIGETTATDIRLYVLLHGFVEATLQGSVTMNADGSSKASFELPEVPQQKITLSLFGGKDKALVTTPKTCGTHTFGATFTSHQGTVRNLQVPVEVSCTDPTFDVGLSTRRPKQHPTLTLAARSPGMRSVSFDLSRYLKVGAHPAGLATLGRYGTATFQTEDGQRELKLKLLSRGRLGSLAFAATEGSSQVTALPAYDAKLEGKKPRKRDLKARRTKGPTRLAFSSLPQGTTQVTLELEGKRDGLIQNPSSCKAKGKRLRLGFDARVAGMGAGGAVLHRSIRMQCAKSKRSRKR